MQTERLTGIDYLKAFFSVCVVLVHLGLISPSLICNKDLYSQHIFTISDFINFYVLLLAVPIFFLISNYLFLRKPGDESTLFAYLKRIGKIALFWTIMLKIFIFHGWGIFKGFPGALKDIPYFILSGGETLYWFFITLLGLTVMTHFARRLHIFHVIAFFIISTIIVAMLPILSVATGKFYLIAHCNPLNFLPYPFAAILVTQLAGSDRANIKPLHIVLAGLIILLFMALDWTIYVNEGFFRLSPAALPVYSRPSLVLIAMAVLSYAIRANLKQNAVVLFMSNKSLSLYCLHIYFVFLVKWLSINNLFISLLLVLMLSYLTAIIVKQFLQDELIK